MPYTEEPLYIGFDESWGKDMSVVLIRYSSGGIDLHRQSGKQFKEHVSEAEKILKNLGLKLKHPDSWWFSSTGGYCTVVPIEEGT